MATTYQTPGVYVEEVSVGPKPIVGAPTNVAAIVGRTDRGPVMEPTEVTSWNEYLAQFGGYLDESYTPESVFGFFQNGGSSIWIVRADDPAYARFQVLDAGGDESFEVRAATAGPWGGNLRIEIGRDTSLGQSRLYSSKVTGSGNLGLTSGTQAEVTVESTAGAAAGMEVLIGGGRTSAASRVGATVDNVLPGNKLLVTPAGTATIPIADDIRVAAVHDTGETELRLVTNVDARPHDVVIARRPDGSEVSASLAAVTAEPVGTRLTLEGTGFDEDLEAVRMGERIERFPVEVIASTPSSTVATTDVTYAPGVVAPAAGELVKLISAAGVEAEWESGSGSFKTGSSAKVVPGPAEVLAKLKFTPYEEPAQIDFTAGDEADLNAKLSAYQWLPAGSVLTLVTSPASNNVDVTRAGSGSALFTLLSGTDVANKSFTGVKIKHDTARPLVLEGSASPRPGDWLQVTGNAIGDRRRIQSVNPDPGVPANTYVVALAETPSAIGASMTAFAWEPTVVEPLRFTLTARLIENGNETDSETYGGLALHPQHQRYYAKPGIVNDASTLITVLERPSGATALTEEAALPASVEMIAPGGVGALSPERIRLGFEQLEKRLEPAICACPDALQLSSELDQAAAIGYMIGHCEAFRRYAVVDAPYGPPDPPRFRAANRTALRQWRLDHVASTHAGTYAPFVRLLNPRPGAAQATIDVPPSGFVMGVMARTDNERGVWKAPANERVVGIVGLQTDFTHRHQMALNEGRVNLIRSFPGRGSRVWGARNSTDDTQWLYTNVRRLFLYLETSIERNTEWVVFEPNDANTWLRVRVSVEEFLDRTWRAGGLAGATPEQAYRVRVGLGQTMTEADIDTGLMIIEVGVAPSKPAEFVVFRISHKRIQSD